MEHGNSKCARRRLVLDKMLLPCDAWRKKYRFNQTCNLQICLPICLSPFLAAVERKRRGGSRRSRHPQMEIEFGSIAGVALYQRMEASVGTGRTDIETGSGIFTVTVTELQPIHSGRVETRTQPSAPPSLRRKMAQDSLRLHIPHPIALEASTPPIRHQNKQVCSDTLALYSSPNSQVLRRSRGVPDLRSKNSGNIEDVTSIAEASSSLTHSTATSISISDLHWYEPAKIARRFCRPVLVSVTDARPDAQPAAKQRTRHASHRLRETTS